jgi:hypothetical protein
MSPDYGLGAEIADKIEDFIRRFCRDCDLSLKTPAHDIAGWVVKEFEKGGKKRGLGKNRDGEVRSNRPTR